MPRIDRTPPSNQIWSKMVWLGRNYLGWYVGLCCLTILVAAANTAVAQVLRMIVDAAVRNSHSELRTALIFGMAVVLLAAFSGFAVSVLRAALDARSVRSLQVRLLGHTMAARLDSLAVFTTGDLINRIHDSAAMAQSAINEEALQILQNVFQIALTLTYLSVVNLPLAVGTFAISLVTPVLSGPLSRRMVALYVARQQAQATQQSFILESVQGIEVVQGLSLVGPVMSKLERLTGEWLSLNRETVTWEAILSRLNYFTIISGFLFVLGYGGHLVIAGRLDAGAVAAFLIAFQQIFNPISQLGALWPRFRQSLAQVERVFDVFGLPAESSVHTVTCPEFSHAPEIILSEIEFNYASDTPALHDVSCTFAGGTITAVIGPSGGGKSTLAALVSGLYSPKQGRLLVNGVGLDDLDRGSWRRQISYVPQDAPLLPGTVYENLTVGSPEANRETVLHAVWAAGMDDFLGALPDGLDTLVGEQGVALSGGQRQRVALARGIVRNAPVCVLDEPTASLDPETERRVVHRLQPWLRGKTVIMITHREALVGIADHVLVMRGGTVTTTDPSAEWLEEHWQVLEGPLTAAEVEEYRA